MERFEARQPIYAASCYLDTTGFVDAWTPDADESIDLLEETVREEMDRRLARTE